jgi:hypothetical protein
MNNNEIYKLCSTLCDQLTNMYWDKETHYLSKFTLDNVKEYIQDKVPEESKQMCGLIVYGMLMMRRDTFRSVDCEFQRYVMFSENYLSLPL